MKLSPVPSYTPKVGDRLYQRLFYGLPGPLGREVFFTEVVKVTRDNVHVRVRDRRTPVRLKLAELRECGAAATHAYFSIDVWMIDRDGDPNAAKKVLSSTAPGGVRATRQRTNGVLLSCGQSCSGSIPTRAATL